MKGRRQKAEKTPSPKKKPRNNLPFSRKPILLRNPTNIGRKAEQYRSRHEAIELGGRSNIALNASYKRNVRLPKGKGEADGCIYLYIIGEVRASGRSFGEWAKDLSSGGRCGALVSDTLCDQRSHSLDSAPPRKASAHHDASWLRSKQQQCLQT